DANNLTSINPGSPAYIGKHPGTAYLELQFYEPGYVEQFEGFGCTARQYCAAMTIDSRTLDMNNGVDNTSAGNKYILGEPEPINWAHITRSGVSQAPANPLFTGTGRTRSTPRIPRPTRAETSGRPTPTTSRCPTRLGISRTAWRSTRRPTALSR